MRVRWTLPATNHLRNIFDYIAADNLEAAYRTARRSREAVLLTARMPYAGRIGRVEGTREFTVSGTPYLVAYRIVHKMVHVLAVLHGAQDWPESL